MAAATRVPLGGDQHMLAESGQVMTTERTTIRRRLSIGRATHRPPWGGRKTGHRFIVAPLMATVAASVAVGVGVSIAGRLVRERRARRERQLGLLGGEHLAGGLQRMALGQLDLALEAIDGGDTPDEKAVHETRKALKRLRALLRLLEPQLQADAYAREDAALGDAGRRLGGARDADVMLATLDALVERHHDALAGRSGVIRLRATLLTERDRARRQTLGDPSTRAQAAAELRACRVRMAAWQLPDRPGPELVEAGLLRLYRQGRSRHRRASRAKASDVLAMHRWRKRVKDLRYAAEMLAPADPRGRGEPPKGKRARLRRKRALADAARLRRLARRADRLGEWLGEDHDLAVLAERISADAERGAPGAIGRRTRKRILKLIVKRRRRLRRRALREGERLYGQSPKKLMRLVRGAHERG